MDMHESLQRILASKQVIGALFYETLLDHHPQIRPYFEGIDLCDQAAVLTMELTVIEVYHRLRSPPARHYLQYLGTKHLKRGIPSDLYGPFRDTLLEVLRSFLAEDWTEGLATD